jgi:NAD(P)-dependent dehydrogenase (short-subunit alcohol dehydrogenase family)
VKSRFDLAGRVAVVTGACGKLGPVWVDALVEAGARVAGLDLPSAPPSPAFAEVMARAGASVVRLDCDVTNRASIETAAQAVVAQLGAPAVLVNNAGIDQPPDSPAGRHHIQDLPMDSFRRMVEVNLLGTFQVTQVFGALMAAHGGGSIINIGSLYASVAPDPHFYDHLEGNAPFVKSPAYGASKAGVVNLSRFFATHWAGAGRAREHAVPRRRAGRPGRAIQGQIRRPGADASHGGGRGLEGPADFPGLDRVVLRDRPRTARRRRLHRMVSTSNRFPSPHWARDLRVLRATLERRRRSSSKH